MNPEITFDKDQRNIFQEGLRLFIKQVDQCVNNGKTTLGVQKSSLRDQINQSLEHINYVCHPNFGSGNLSGIPSISFYRNDLFSLLKVNREKPSLQNGVYIWFGYSYDEELYYLKFAFPNGDIDNSRCIAVNKMEQDGICNPNGKYWFEWKKNDNVFEEIPNKFLELVKYFNQFPAKDFQDNKAKGKLEEAFKKFEDKLYPYNNQTSQELQHLASENKVRVLPSSKTQNSALYLLKAPYKGIKALATNSNDPFSNHISCADFLRYCDNEEITYSWAEPIFKLILKEEYENVSDFSQENTDDETPSNNTNIPLNQILYGSPGTGKTYSTIDKALEILGVNTKSKSRQELKTLFEDYKSKGQIEFVTFHQNYGYEEFVEGIKPQLNENDGENEDLEYEIKEGIFKKICNTARYTQKKIDNPLVDSTSRVWKISLGGKTWNNTPVIQEYCFEKGEIRIGWGDASKNDKTFKELGEKEQISISHFRDNMQIGDLVCVLDTVKTIKAIGIIESDFQFDDNQFHSQSVKELGDFCSFRKVKWINQETQDIISLNNKRLTLQTVYPLDRISPIDLLSLLKDKQSENTIDNTQKPHILIIDEINRGNISKIFGELITLIEPSKRIGAEEELRVTLPYSQTSFGVPSNLYIIGTMNTADRSITSLDTALRRRFEFVEMMPDATKLEGKVIEGINLQKMLTAINERIEFLYDREKTIGHAYLLDIKNLDDLKEAFQNKIIPLLQEYFYRNYALIQAVLNDNGMIKEIEDSKKTSIINCKGFKKLENIDFESKTIYSISDDENLWDDPQTYINIYEG